MSAQLRTKALVLQWNLKSDSLTFGMEKKELKSTFLATIAWVRRFIHNLRRERIESKFAPLTAEEMQEAESWLLKEVQNSTFDNEILMTRKGAKLEKSKSGLWRVGGRIHKSLLSEEEKHPIILPLSHPVAELLILH